MTNPQSTLTFGAHAFGLRWASDRPLPLFPSAPAEPHPVDITVRRVAPLAVRHGGTRVNAGRVFADGVRFERAGAVFDMTGGSEIAWSAPEDDPSDGPPDSFYSTVTALLLAWRGGVPVHGSAVEIDGRAILLCGPAGSGKSTLAAALIAHGGRLVSDDLSLLAPTGACQSPMLWPGRPAIRLVDPAAPIGAEKMLVRTAMSDVMQPVRLGTLLLLQSRPVHRGLADGIEVLRRQMFRPVWMRAMPRRAERLETIMNAARALKIHAFPSARDAGDISPERRAAAACALAMEA